MMCSGGVKIPHEQVVLLGNFWWWLVKDFLASGVGIASKQDGFWCRARSERTKDLYWVVPLPSKSGQWRFRLESGTKSVKFLVVTFVLLGGHPNLYMVSNWQNPSIPLVTLCLRMKNPRSHTGRLGLNGFRGDLVGFRIVLRGNDSSFGLFLFG